ncbi:MAG: hypothetical protein WC317_02770 [Candidatus Omnitrophota bacterium]|jgi:hypothetical protein
MASFKDIMEMMAKKKVPEPQKEFWLKFDRELRERLDAIDSRKSSRGYGFAESLGWAFSAIFQPKPVLVAATLVVAINLMVFSLSSGGSGLVSVALLSRDDLAGEFVLTEELASGENIVDF